MNKSWFYLSAISSLSIIVAGCGDGSQQPPTPAASPGAAASPATPPTAKAPPTPVSPNPTTTATATPAPAIPEPLTGKKPGSDLAAGLIPATDADSWTKTVSKGRIDPFAMMTLQPIEIVNKIDPLAPSDVANNKPSTKPTDTNQTKASGSEKPLPAIKVGAQITKNSPRIATIKPTTPSNTGGQDRRNIDISQIPRSGIDRKLPKITVALKPTGGSTNSESVRRPITAIKPAVTPSLSRPNIVIKPLPQPLKTNPDPGVNSIAPTKPEPQLARTIGISGVIEVGGKTQVIVKIPNESFSRYVEVGDFIYDGKIKVKRVEGEQTLSPIVILEEVGVEITRKVGDLPGAATPASPVK